MNEAGRAYLEWYYGNNVWKYLSYRGVRTLKLPLDMWNYQEIIFENDLHWVVETGTRHGGSALYFADLLAAGRREGVVVSIDVTHQDLSATTTAHPGIRFLLGDSASAAIRDQAAVLVPQQRRGGLLLMLDSDHAAPHVLRELETWVPWLRRGDYLIVEDTIVNGHPVRPDFGPGPYEAVAEYLTRHPGRLQPDGTRENKFACTFAASGFFRIP